MVSYLALRVSEDTDGYVPRWARDWTDHTTDRTALVFRSINPPKPPTRVRRNDTHAQGEHSQNESRDDQA
jgi:hypothetical protein